ncbi:MAG: single-stranded-DNA-specific exonuclease RecJ [bacterium]
MSFTQTRWNFRQADANRVRQFAGLFRLNPVVAQIMVQRGFDDPLRAERFLQPDLKRLTDPEGVPGMAEAANLIVESIRQDRTIVIYSDYDVDGVCGLTVLIECLRLAGARKVFPYIPHRIEEGYGINAEAVRSIAAKYPGALVVSIDCGITSVDQVALARSLGLDVIVTDHHSFKAELPAANVLVHPRLPGADPFCENLCGAGVAFKLAWQVAKHFGDGQKASPNLRMYLMRAMGLVALATVADVMPLVDDNRILVKHGIESLNMRRGQGLDHLLQMSGVRADRPVSAGTIAFQIAPRINAAGRMNHAFKAFELLTADCAEDAVRLVEELEEVNRQRREIEAAIVSEARFMYESGDGAADRSVVVVAKGGWHMGVIGIAAARLVDHYHRPSIVLSIDEKGVAHGSGRSISGVNLVETLEACSEHLMTFGGHAAAAGMKLKASEIDRFRERFDAEVASRRPGELGHREIWIDVELEVSQLTVDLVRAMESLEPYGQGNPRPLLAASGLELTGDPMLMGQQQNHVRLNMKQNNRVLKVVAWGQPELADRLEAGKRYDVAFTPAINQWQDMVSVQAELKAIRESELR